MDNQLDNFAAELKAEAADPSRLSGLIIEAIKEIDEVDENLLKNRDLLQNIKERPFWQRLAKSSSKDLAQSGEEQNQIIAMQNMALHKFFQIMRASIALNLHNTQFLIKLSAELKSGAKRLNIKDSSLFDMATSFLDESIKAVQHHDEQIAYLQTKLEGRLIPLELTIKEQEKKLANLEQKIIKLSLNKKLKGHNLITYFFVVINIIFIIFILAFFFTRL
ncbi:MAG: hypothetical protein FWE37_00030 [Spirochaetaceae bacterium]|nr:hypothetical protein [Spirochaetaceae bacterium]